MDTDDSAPSSDDFWERFVSLMSVMRDLGCLSFFMDHSVAQVVQGEVRLYSVVTTYLVMFILQKQSVQLRED